jgi:hypothetical protein
MIGRGLVVLAAVFTLFLVASNSQAEMTRVIVDGWTHNDVTPPENAPFQQMQIHVQVFDTVFSRGPDFVASIIVTAPDGSEFSLDPSKDYLHHENAYFKGFDPSLFRKGKIPGGTYSVKVTSLLDLNSVKIESDFVDASILDRPNVTSPFEGEIIVDETPIFTWTAPKGATYYRLWIWDNWAREPVYWWFSQQLRTEATSVAIPRGALKPGRGYSFRVEARSATLDMDKRSRSAWVNFTTGSW